MTQNIKQPEALRLAETWQAKAQREASRQNSAYDVFGMGNTPESVDPLGASMAAELCSLHARVQELEASQAQRLPLTDAQIKEGRNAVNDAPDDRPEPWAFREGVKFAEHMHGITQEKQ